MKRLALARLVVVTLVVVALCPQASNPQPAQGPGDKTAGGLAPPSESSPARKKIPLYWAYAIPDQDTSGPFTLNKTHPLLDGAIINAKWAEAHPEPGRFDWRLLDKKISDWTAGTDKKVFIAIALYAQTPRPGSPTGDNTRTPSWVYDKGVPRITFAGGGVAKGATVSVPKVWDQRFYPIYEEFLAALAAHYNGDPRVAGYQLGFGHVGTMNAQPSHGGSAAFLAAGWTPAVWEEYVKRIIDLSKKHLGKKVLIVKTPGAFLRGVRFEQNVDMAKRLLRYPAEQGMWVLLNGLTANPKAWGKSRMPELVAYLGSLNLPAGFAIGFTDDWPLWVPPDRSQKCPGSTCGRDASGFEKELRLAQEAWDKTGRKYPIFLVILNPEAGATNENNKGAFKQDVYEVARRFLFQTGQSP